MNKPFFLLFSFFLINSLHAFWPFSSKSRTTSSQTTHSKTQQTDQTVNDINSLINCIDQLKNNSKRVQEDTVITALKHIDEMQEKEILIQQKNTENEQLKKQLEFFVTAYMLLCKTFQENALSIQFDKDFEVLKNRLDDLDNNPEISTDMQIAAENVNNAVKHTLLPLYSEFKLKRDKEIKNNLIAAINEQKIVSIK